MTRLPTSTTTPARSLPIVAGSWKCSTGLKVPFGIESTACGLAQTAALTEGLDAAAFIAQYLSRAHRDHRATGCTMAALGGDAARQPEAVRMAFAEGIEQLVALLNQRGGPLVAADPDQARARILDAMAHAVGALVMSRACPDDSPLADEILAVSRDAILASFSAPRTATPTACQCGED